MKASGEESLDILDDPDKVYRIVEQYADRGMEILIEDIFKPYIKEQEDGTLTIVYDAKADLLKNLIHYIDNLNVETSPFN